MDSKAKPHTPLDAYISSVRSVSRRSLLGMSVIGAGVAAVAVLLPVAPSEAQFKGYYGGGVSVASGDVNDAPRKKPAFKTQSPRKKLHNLFVREHQRLSPR